MNGLPIAYELPEKTLGNEELAALYPGWTAEKIFAKTGISSRHVTVDGETATDLAERAAKRLFAESGISPDACDFVLFCSHAPDYHMPASACLLQDRLGLPTTTGALDIGLGCSGYIYGLATAKGLIAGGLANNVLLLTGETLTKFIHPLDKSARTLFGDAAAATWIDRAAAGRIGAFSLGTDGAGARHLIIPTGGARRPVEPDAPTETDASGNTRTINNFQMDGPGVFRFTLDVVPKMIAETCARNGITPKDIDLFAFHQANAFMLDAIRTTNAIPKDKFVVDMADVGNTVSSTIPIVLARAAARGTLRPGMRVMLAGFGVGLSWGATIIEW